MKTAFKSILVMMFAMISLISCRNDKEETPTLVGTWQPISMKFSGTFNGMPISQSISANDCQKNSRQNFTSNGTGTSTVWDDSSGSCTQEPAESFSYVYDTNSKNLNITTDGITQQWNVTTLSSTTLTMNTNSSFDYNGINIPGANLEVTLSRVP